MLRAWSLFPWRSYDKRTLALAIQNKNKCNYLRRIGCGNTIISYVRRLHTRLNLAGGK